jgi:hypothetical protein
MPRPAEAIVKLLASTTFANIRMLSKRSMEVSLLI